MLPPGHAGTRVEHRDSGAWLFLDRPWDDETAEEFDRLKCVGLWLNSARGWEPGPGALGFLPSLAGSLRHLLVQSPQIAAADEISQLTRLQSLSLETNFLQEPVDLEPLQELAVLSLSGDNYRLGTLPFLRDLTVVELTDTDLARLTGCAGLQRLVLKACRTRSITGIEGLPVESMWLATLGRLTDPDALSALPHLKLLEIDRCPGAVRDAAWKLEPRVWVRVGEAQSSAHRPNLVGQEFNL